MNAVAAIVLFAASTAFWGWVVFGGGADRLEGSFLSGFLVWYRAPEWPAEAIKLFGVLAWLVSFGWFILHLCAPGVW